MKMFYYIIIRYLFVQQPQLKERITGVYKYIKKDLYLLTNHLNVYVLLRNVKCKGFKVGRYQSTDAATKLK